MRVALLHQYFHRPDAPLDGRHHRFVRHLAERHEVTVITSRAELPPPHDPRLAAPPGVRVRAFDVPYANRMGAAERLVAFVHFAARAALAAAADGRFDVLVGSSTPLTVGAAAAAAARVRGVPWVFEVRDLWPDFLVEMGALPRRLQPLAYALERRLYRSAAHVVTLSPDMTRHVRAAAPGTRASTVLHGTDFDLATAEDDGAAEALWRRHVPEGAFGVVYAGALGRANGIPDLLAAAERLRTDARIRFLVAGKGFHREGVARAAARLPNLVLLPPQPRPRMLRLLARAGVSLVLFRARPSLDAASPAKLYDSLGVGTPVVVTNDGWTRRLVEREGCGWYAPAGDPAALAARLAALADAPADAAAAGGRGRTYARDHFDRARLAARFETILVDAAARRYG